MSLLTERDFAEFHKAATTELDDVVWTKGGRGSEGKMGEDDE
jgi:hypothetical protein